MAIYLGNPFSDKVSDDQGDRFEIEIREKIRRGLPDTYFFQHNVVVDNRQYDRDRPTAREIDFAVAGPNGLFLIEAKSVNPRPRGFQRARSAPCRRAQ